MLYTNGLFLALTAISVYANPANAQRNGQGNKATTTTAAAAAGGGNADLTLDPTVVQTGSAQDGSKAIGAAEVGQALSTTSDNNFINFCKGKTLTNGLQIVTGSCNGIRKLT